MGNPKIKLDNLACFSGRKEPYKTPQLPRIPPQIHHVFTTTKHPKIEKSPAKTTFPPPNIFLKEKTPSPFSSSGR
jgi:hypothetical protein